MIMRKEHWSTNFIYYKYLDNNDKIILDASKGTYCYSALGENKFNINNSIILFDFHKEETEIYIKDYLKKLSKIFNIKIVYINDDEIKVSGFKSYFYFKLFLTLFRYLFENTTGNIEMVKNFFKSYIEDKRNKDLLYKLIDNFNKTKFRLGNNNHCIYNNKTLNLKTTKDLENYSSDKNYSLIHNFFIT